MESNGNLEIGENGNSNTSTQTSQFDGYARQIGVDTGVDTGDAFGSLFLNLFTKYVKIKQKTKKLSNEIFKNSHRQATGVCSTDINSWYYNMKHKHRGVALIFNHESFVVGDLKARNGTDADCFNLGDTLQKLDFDVTTYTDLTYKEMDEKLDYWANKDYTDYDCIFVAILSHGEHGIIYARDAPYKPEDKVWGRFTGDKCVTLAGKPKLFFIQACQGDRLDSGVMLTTQVDGGPSSFKIPNHADFLIAYSTIPGFYSWRNTQKGSWFIQAVCFAFNQFGYELDLLTIMTFVNRKVAIDSESNCPGDSRMHGQKQIPCITSMLTRLVKFEKKIK